MTNQNSKSEEDKRRFSQEQYDMLKRCSDAKDMTEWNNWRKDKENRHKDIELEGASLGQCYLKDVHLNLRGGYLLNKDETFDTSRKGRSNVHLKGAHLDHANLMGARLMNADLEGAELGFAHMEGADISEANLKNAKAQRAKVNGSTSLWECKVNRYCKNNEFTDFSGVALDDASIDPGTKQLLEYNIRRMNWEDWYRGKKTKKPVGKVETTKEKWLRKGCVIGRLVATSPVRGFWLMSDYGRSTGRIILSFFILALFFAAIYANCAYGASGIVSNLAIEPHLPRWHYDLLLFLRPIYFSVVTMTTLGFGDMYANEQSVWGHILLMLQVILGYVLLGALITRFAVLFTAGGPAGKFADEKTMWQRLKGLWDKIRKKG